MDDFLDSLARTPPVEISPTLLIVLVAVAAALSIPQPIWKWFGLFTTLVHELGHAIGAILTGRFVHGMKIRMNHSGEAVSSGRGKLGAAISGSLGYPAPAIVGAVQLWCVTQGYTALALFVGGIILILTLLVIRNLFGFLVVAVSAAASAALWLWATPTQQSYVLLVLAIALLVGSVRGLATVIGVHTRRRDKLGTSDAYLLFRRTGIPSAFWLLLFSALIAANVVWAVTTVLESY
ncbi:M50 family metallopeptidase [Salinibacterium sp. G-O1]|uniref:M50 family metallopeptidase n=1 Tax=Salinibacterium sp. G-O1 TaxID=3046208 RepID=UPI0024BB5362|nr:M50 family metallopeptidase [Salinibacterium sp. G-O1]MDJ0333976.1 M50 family metallopeptidase [Salinibacterium sp. G-O1]